MDSTVQTVQEVGNQVSQYRQMFENYLPDITKFGIKVVLAIIAFWVGSTVIKWIVKFVRKSLTKSRLDTYSFYHLTFEAHNYYILMKPKNQ